MAARGVRALITLSLLGLVVLVYGRVVYHDFLDFDDSEYVYENPVVRDGLSLRGVVWAFAFSSYAHWHPLTWISHMADVQVFGLNPGAHHAVNVLLHAFNTVLLFVLLTQMTGAIWPSAMTAALFGIHPQHVESVAWISERKDVLSTCFWLLTMIGYTQYTRTRSRSLYAAALAAFALGLLSKPMLVSLPLVLLLLDHWPLGRSAWPRAPTTRSGAGIALSLGALTREKIPFFALAATSAVVTFIQQTRWGATWSLTALSLGDRVSNAIVSYAIYLQKTVAPASLAAFYPHPATVGESIPPLQVAIAAAVLLAISALVTWQGRRHPYLAVGWLWYVITLAPVIGLVQIGSQARADRYTYVPLIGIYLMGCWTAAEVLERSPRARPFAASLALGVLLMLSVAAWRQVGYWRNGATLYTHALEVTENNWLAWNNLGMQRLNTNDLPGALSCFREAAQIKPDYADAWYNMGVTFARLGRPGLAAQAYERSLGLEAQNADGWINLGVARQELGDSEGAIEAYESGLRLRPDDSVALYNLALAYVARGSWREAMRAAERLRLLDAARAMDLMAKIRQAAPQSGPSPK